MLAAGVQLAGCAMFGVVRRAPLIEVRNDTVAAPAGSDITPVILRAASARKWVATVTAADVVRCQFNGRSWNIEVDVRHSGNTFSIYYVSSEGLFYLPDQGDIHSTYNRQVPLVGSLVWDLWELLKDRDPKYMGVQYDVMHARAESGPSWQRGLGLIAPWIGTLCLKDFKFAMDPKYPGDWKRVLVPAGEGIVDWAEFLAICRREGVAAPYSVHYDYPFPENDAVAAVKAAKKDLDFFRSHLGE